MDDSTQTNDDPTQNENSPFDTVPIEITVTVGRARPLIRDLIKLKNNSVLPLDSQVDDAVELYVGERLIGRGQLEEITEGTNMGRLAVRFTELFDRRIGAV